MERFISQQQNSLDEIIATAARKYYLANNLKPNFYFDVFESCKEQWLLSDKNKKDLCYDRPSIGFTYSLWYHAKRVNTFLKYFITQLSKDTNPKINFFDLGAGAGAVQWAIGLVYAAMKNSSLKTPEISIVNIDTSPFMQEYNEKYLWPEFLHKFPCCNEIDIKYQVNSWTNSERTEKSSIWIVASYLFDNSESKNQVGADFQQLIKDFKANKVFLTTSFNKKEYLEKVANSLVQTHLIEPQPQNVQVYTGPLNNANQFRQELNKVIIEKNTIVASESPFNNQAKWDIDSLAGVILTKKQQELGLLYNSISLFNPPFKREKVILNEMQQAAAVPENRPTKIVGPAGCGKSVVVSERIKNLVEKADYDPSLRILLTTFNKDLIKHLGDWLDQIMNQRKIKRFFVGNSESWFCFQGSSMPSLYLYHFDILPTRIGNLSGDVRTGQAPGTKEEIHCHLMRQALEKYILDPAYEEIKLFASPDFLLDEYHRIIYGYNINNESKYQTLKRSGRGRPLLKHNSEKRELIYKIINTYSEILKNRGYESFTTMRKRFLEFLESGILSEDKKFSHIFIDELQDCTYADYQIFYKLLKKGNHQNILFAGDIAQSIQLGTSLYIPKAEDVTMGNWNTHLLEGSYRLPLRVSEAIHELSKQINTRFGKREDMEVSVISPYRGAPPGSRIIFLYAETESEMVLKIKSVYNDYKSFFNNDESTPVTVYENDYEIVKAITKAGLKVEDEHILRSKGMEKKFVFWSTRSKIERENEVYEFVYTILTRTCALLVVGLSETTMPIFRKIINTFRRDRIILWDDMTKKKFESFCTKDDATAVEEEES